MFSLLSSKTLFFCDLSHMNFFFLNGKYKEETKNMLYLNQIFKMEINNFADNVIGETGIVNNLTSNSQTIFLDHNYDNPVIFAQPLSYNGAEAAIVRIEDIKGDRFTASVQEPSNLDGKHGNESFSYLVLEKGTWQLEDDTLLEVGKVNTNLLSSDGWKNVNFTNDFADDPLIFSQVQTDNGSDLVHTRQRNTNNSGFQITMQEEEARNNSGHATETLGWLAIDAGKGKWSQNNYLARQTVNSVNHDWHTVGFKNNFSQSPVFLASIGTYHGADPSGLRYSNLNRDRVKLKIEEDTSKDAEVYHSNEAVNFLAIAGNNPLRGFPFEEKPSGGNSSSGVGGVNWNSLIEKSKTDSFIHYGQSGGKRTIVGPQVNFNRTLTWESPQFQGDYIAVTARPDAKALTVHVDGTGGFAGYVNEYVPTSWDEIVRVDAVHQDVTIEGKVEHTFGNESNWVSGPKISTRPCNKKSECEDIWESGWNENYIVENSLRTPEQMHEIYTRPARNGKYLGETYHDGSTYKHYSYTHPNHGKWKMFTAIRQNYRLSGEVHVAPILKKWRNNGMKNGYINWVEYNIELFGKGPWEGTMEIKNFQTTDNWKTGK